MDLPRHGTPPPTFLDVTALADRTILIRRHGPLRLVFARICYGRPDCNIISGTWAADLGVEEVTVETWRMEPIVDEPFDDGEGPLPPMPPRRPQPPDVVRVLGATVDGRPMTRDELEAWIDAQGDSEDLASTLLEAVMDSLLDHE